MAEMQEVNFAPDYSVPPGEILEEYLESASMTQAELAQRTGLAAKTVNQIIQGKASLTQDTALRLESVLGRPAHFWNQLEAEHQEYLARARATEREREQLEWLKRFPINKMQELGWISTQKDRRAQLHALLQFFGVHSSCQWAKVWEHHQVAYRQSQRFKAEAEAVSAWLRRGELQGHARDCTDYDATAFRNLLKDLRGLTRESPEVFQAQIQERCASAGVAVEFVPSLPGTRVSGATRWLTPTKALIQLSLRYRSDDQLWFSFFHEAGHVLLHGKRAVFIEGGNGLDEHKEDEANRFAADILIPPREWQSFVASGQPTLAQVRDFAEQLGVAPGIVVGRLQHESIVGWEWGNGLKQRFQWDHE
ncbi:HigA family addiction module antitoxin [Ectothiorhodospira marina]|uniref:Addiction module antidote protein, HigA family n=1 Tax=Ectothiorhodospira marina TaxID=1396821 RepID=A0A1H7RK39_9GAMM|nr:HigA family addiction module antitoxin [Ectothiorhodospira marina]SEL60583.1 addiction module antidote protein, HigA family [Ectothiorhodospira marina]